MVEETMNRLEKFINAYNKVTFLWFFAFAFFVTCGMIISLLGVVGLAEMQKDHPNAFHGNYLNYNTMWTLVSIWPAFFSSFSMFSVLALYRKISLPKKKTMPKGWKKSK